MSLLNQLRITDPDDQLTIYDLDEAGSITRLGQDEANDIQIEGPGVAPVQLELDYRQEPYRLTVPDHADPVSVNGEAVPPGSSCEIQDRDEIRVGGYAIVFRVREKETDSPDELPEPLPQPEPEPSPPDDVPAPAPQPEPDPRPPQDDEPAPAPLPEPGPPAPAPDTEHVEPAILTSVSPEVWAVDVEQTVTFQLSVVNAGELVADFDVEAEGVPQDWVTLSPAEFHLNEGEEETVVVSVTPPRSPASRAGTHLLTLVVTSPTYPGERSQASATVTIHPYYDLTVGNLTPRHLSIPGFQRAGRLEVPLTNRGNSDVVAILAGEDDARACHFEFEIPDQMERALYLTKEADLWVPVDQTVSVPVELVPWNRPLIGAGGRLFDLRTRIHPFTVSVAMAEGGQRPWTLSGEWENVPRLSRRVLLISALALILLLLLSFYPGITDYNLSATTRSIRAGQLVELTWRARPLISFKLNGQPVEPPVTLRPEQTTTYELRAETWLSRLLPFLEGRPDEITIGVMPVRPDILLFEASAEQVIPGETVILSWVVDDADGVVLIDHTAGLQETLTSPYGSREIQVGQDPIRYTLRAIAADGSVVEGTVAVAVEVGSPVIRVFSVKPSAITSKANTLAEMEMSWWVIGRSKTEPEDITLSRSPTRTATPTPGPTLTPTAAPAEGRGATRTATPTPTPIRTLLPIPRGTATVEGVDYTTVFSLCVDSGTTQVVATARVKLLKDTPVPSPTTPRSLARAPTANDEAPGLIAVYTALSEDELETLGAFATKSLTDILDKVGVPELPLSETELEKVEKTKNGEAMAEVLRRLSETELTREELEEYDYVYCVPPAPQAINILIIRRSTQDLIRLLLAEKENPRADVIWGVAASGMIRLRAEGLLEPMAGPYQPQGLENIPASWRDPTWPPHWLGLSVWPAAFCVNEKKLLAEGITPPESWSWADLIDSKYSDLIAMPSPYTSGTGYMLVSGLLQMFPFGEPDGWEYLDLLHENILWYANSGAEPCRWAENDSPIAIGIGALPDDASANLRVFYPEEGYAWEMDAVALVRKDTYNEDALAFVRWAISREAMVKYAEFRPVVAYEGGVPAKAALDEFDRAKLLPNRLLWASANYERITEKWLSRYASEPGLLQLEPAE